jgi:glycosyltransferase involved in cell wall biosynthesis
MQCPKLSELPAPNPGKKGWPWTEESRRLPPHMPNGSQWPRISVVTPSFNQAKFIEETIRSVLLQGYPNCEYFILDGGSKDRSVEIIKKYSPWLTYWASERDKGQSDAINRGMKMASGDFATWINSDDMLCKDAMFKHVTQNDSAANMVYVGICVYIDMDANILFSHRGRVHCLEDLVRIRTVWRAPGQIVQPEVLFPRELYLDVGGLDCNNDYTMDFDLWGKFFLKGAKFQYTDIDFGMFRLQPNQKTQNGLAVTESLIDVAKKFVYETDSFSENLKQAILEELDAFELTYLDEYWRRSGRLARIGLPRRVVEPLRNLRRMLRNKAQKLLNATGE